jgi:hypothetical protein
MISGCNDKIKKRLDKLSLWYKLVIIQYIVVWRKIMPLKKGTSKKTTERNIGEMLKAEHPSSLSISAYVIALDEARKSRKGPPKKKGK